MDAAIAGALIGVVGVGVGACAAFAGVVYQQRHATRAAVAAQKRSEATAAAEQILKELLAVKQVLRRGPYDLAEDEGREFRRIKQGHHASIQLHSQWLPDSELRTRLDVNALYVEIGPWGDSRTEAQFRGDGMIMCEDSIACLGAFLRSEKLPEKRSEAAERVIAQWPEGQHYQGYVVTGPVTEDAESE